MRMYLGIDTSTRWAGLALAKEGELIAELSWISEQNQCMELLPSLINLLIQTKRELREIKGLCVALGPGSFNGLRVGVSTAKGLAYALDIPLVGVSTLEAEAYPFHLSSFDVCSLHGAGRGEVAAALFRRLRGKWIKLMEEQILSPEGLCSYIKRKTICCGEIPGEVEDFLKSKLGSLALFLSPVIRARRPGNVLYLGMERLLKGERDDPVTLQPLYLRRPPITTPRKGKFGLFEFGGANAKD